MNYSIPKLVDRWLRTGETTGPENPIKRPRRNPFTYDEWFVDGQNGSDVASGLAPDEALKTITEVLSRIRSGDVVYLTGNFAEEAGNTPLNVEDVRFIGMGSHRPRHADAARDAKTNHLGETNQNSGCSWRPPTTETGTTPMITVVHQGWSFENILFDAPSDAACISLAHSAVSGADDGGGGHLLIRNCRFDAGHAGIDDQDGNGYVTIEDSFFRGLADGIRTVSTSTAIPLHWVLRRNWFMNNTNHIMVSASRWVMHDNFFDLATTFGIDLINVSAQGSNNIITRNYLAEDYTTANYLFDSTDEAAGNYSMDVTETEVDASGLTVAVPAA